MQYIYRALDSGEGIDKEKMMDTIYYLDAETVSKAFACLLEQGATSSKDELSPYLSQSLIEKWIS